MNNRADDKLAGWARFSEVALLAVSGVTASFGILALVGWTQGRLGLAGFSGQLVPMAPSSALLFSLFGLAVGLRVWPGSSMRMRRVSTAIVWGVGSAAGGIFVLCVRQIQWSGEHLGFVVSASSPGLFIGHMSPVTAIGLLLAGGSFLAAPHQSSARPWRFGLALGAVAVLLGICVASLLCILFGVPLFSSGANNPPALPSLLALVVLGLGMVILASRPYLAVRPDRIKVSFGIILFVVLGSGIVADGYVYYRSFEKFFRQGAEDRLNAVAVQKAADLTFWRRNRLGDGDIFYQNPSFSSLVRRLLDSPTDEEARRLLQIWVRKEQASGEYDQFHLLDAQGVTRLSGPAGLAPPSGPIREAAAQAQLSGQLSLQDFYRHESDGRVYLALIIPILDSAAAGPPLGVLVLRIDPVQVLYAMVQRWPGPSSSGEVVLLRREGNGAVSVAPTRFRRDAALDVGAVSLEKTENPGVRAIRGERGIMEGRDYRGIPVLAAVLPVAESPWFLVVKMDEEEAYAPLRERMWGTVLLAGIMIFSVGTALNIIWRRQRDRFFRQRFEAEQALRISESRFRDVMETIALYGVVLDPASRITYANDFLLNHTGWARAEVLGQNWFELFLPADVRERIERPIFSASITSGTIPAHFENEIVTRRGERLLIAWNNTVLRDGSGAVTGVASIGEDITVRRRADLALRESEDRFRRLAENAPDMIYRYDLRPKRGFTYVSPSSVSITGFTPEEHYADLNASFRLVHRGDLPSLLAVAKGKFTTGDPISLRWVRKDGRVIWVELRNVPILDAEGRIIAVEGVARDITAHKVREALREVGGGILRLLNDSGDVPAVTRDIVVLLKERMGVDAAGIRLQAGDFFPYLAQEGFSAEFLQSENAMLVRDAHGQASRNHDGAAGQSCACGLVLSGRIDPANPLFSRGGSFWTSDPSRGPAVLSDGDPGLRQDYVSQVLVPIRSNEQIVGLIHLGSRQKNFFTLESVEYLEGIAGHLGAALARRRADELIRVALHENEALLREVHHRVKNNLQVIVSLLRLEAGRSNQAATRTVLTEMKGRIRSMAQLHETIYRTGVFDEVDLAVYLKQLATELFRSVGGLTGAVRLRLDLESVRVELDQAIPCGLIVNELITNCLKHGFPDARSGAIRIESRALEGGARGWLRVADDGVGLPAAFDLKALPSLGLQLVSDLVSQIDGRLEIEPGPGTAVTITFPTVKQTAPAIGPRHAGAVATPA